MSKNSKIINIGETETEVRQKQHDNNPGKAIVDIFCRGIDIPDEELSEDLKETVDAVRKGLRQEEIKDMLRNGVITNEE